MIIKTHSELIKKIADANESEQLMLQICAITGDSYDDEFKNKLNDICESLPYTRLDTLEALRFELVVRSNSIVEARHNIERRLAQGDDVKPHLYQTWYEYTDFIVEVE